VKARSPGVRHGLETKVTALLDHRYPNLETQSAADTKHEIGQEINRTFNLFNAIVIIAVVVSLLGVINTLAMSVIERTRGSACCGRSAPRAGRCARRCSTRVS
jgi:putative ABC transport system permease protein